MADKEATARTLLAYISAFKKHDRALNHKYTNPAGSNLTTLNPYANYLGLVELASLNRNTTADNILRPQISEIVYMPDFYNIIDEMFPEKELTAEEKANPETVAAHEKIIAKRAAFLALRTDIATIGVNTSITATSRPTATQQPVAPIPTQSVADPIPTQPVAETVALRSAPQPSEKPTAPSATKPQEIFVDGDASFCKEELKKPNPDLQRIVAEITSRMPNLEAKKFNDGKTYSLSAKDRENHKIFLPYALRTNDPEIIRQAYNDFIKDIKEAPAKIAAVRTPRPEPVLEALAVPTTPLQTPAPAEPKAQKVSFRDDYKKIFGELTDGQPYDHLTLDYIGRKLGKTLPERNTTNIGWELSPELSKKLYTAIKKDDAAEVERLYDFIVSNNSLKEKPLKEKPSSDLNKPDKAKELVEGSTAEYLATLKEVRELNKRNNNKDDRDDSFQEIREALGKLKIRSLKVEAALSQPGSTVKFVSWNGYDAMEKALDHAERKGVRDIKIDKELARALTRQLQPGYTPAKAAKDAGERQESEALEAAK